GTASPDLLGPRRPERAADAPGVAVARRRDGRGEGRAHPRRRGPRGPLLRAAGLLRGPRPAPEGRAHEPLRGGGQRGDRRGGPGRVGLPRGDPGRAHRRPRARAPGRGPGRGAHRGPLSRAQARAGQRHHHAGDLHAPRRRGRLRPGHPPLHRRGGHGHDRLPVRAAARGGPRPRAPGRGRLLGGRDRADPRRGPRRHAQPARPRDAAPRAPGALRRRHRRPHAPGHRGGVDVQRDLRAHEALRRGRRGREGPPQAALRRGLRARDAAGGARHLRRPGRRHVRLRPAGEPRDDPPAQRHGRALRPARRAARGDRHGRAPPPPHVHARVAGRGGRL
ncbi:MAG: GTP cyclohydrolase MptA, partial [uncultured Solirubrobacteraceae bacterium]